MHGGLYGAVWQLNGLVGAVVGRELWTLRQGCYTHIGVQGTSAGEHNVDRVWQLKWSVRNVHVGHGVIGGGGHGHRGKYHP